MKKLATLLLAAGLVFGAATGASAIDFKASGEWVMGFELGSNGDFNAAQGGFKSGEDNFEAEQRLRLKIDAVASENLSGTVMFEIGETRWGQNTDKNPGGQLGTDGLSVEVKRAYIDWIAPNTDLSLRMGLQGVALPSFVNGNQVLDDDVAAIVANYKFNDNVALTALWARPFNDNYTGYYSQRTKENGQDTGMFDNVDVFAAVVPMTFDGIKVTPWVAYGMIGKNAYYKNNDGGYTVGYGDTTDTYARHKADAYGSMFAAGLTGEVTMADPFRFAWDLEYSGYKSGFDGKKHLGVDSRDQAGWVFTALGEYKMDWGTPGLYAWYASGDDDNRYNGSEQIFQLNNGASEFGVLAFDGSTSGIGRDSLLGENVAGTWGIGARVKDMSFLEGLKHTFRVTYMMGTNSNDSIAYRGGKTWKQTALDATNHDVKYNLGTTESALEVSLTNTYQIYENLTMIAEVAYLKAFLDDELRWDAAAPINGQKFEQGDAFNANVSFKYSF